MARCRGSGSAVPTRPPNFFFLFASEEDPVNLQALGEGLEEPPGIGSAPLTVSSCPWGLWLVSTPIRRINGFSDVAGGADDESNSSLYTDSQTFRPREGEEEPIT